MDGKVFLKDKAWYLGEISKELDGIDNLWVLKQILLFAKNIGKDEG